MSFLPCLTTREGGGHIFPDWLPRHINAKEMLALHEVLQQVVALLLLLLLVRLLLMLMLLPLLLLHNCQCLCYSGCYAAVAAAVWE